MQDLINVSGAITEQAFNIITAPIPKDQIKQRDTGFGKKLSYISGSTVIDLLNRAFNYRWSFIIKEEKTIQSIPKKGSEKVEPPYVQVLGQLTIPDLGVVKEQYGTKIILGGASEQEGATKAAATDALKKCATLVGIGLELYEDPEPPANTNKGTNKKPDTKTPPTMEWNPEDIVKIKELKAILGIDTNKDLDPYAREFLNNKDSSYSDITPLNIRGFNKFLKEKAEAV